MDLHCTTCGEPHDIDCLHEADEYGLTVHKGRIVECSACEWHRKRGFPMKQEAQMAIAMHDIMGDDIDGIASMMEDMGF
jgi:hypothetical protein